MESDRECNTVYPEGGIRAWLSVLGSLCGMMCCFGLMNTIGDLSNLSCSQSIKSHIEQLMWGGFSVFTCLLHISVVSRPVRCFDAQGPKVLMIAGSTCLVLTMFLLGVCKGLSIISIHASPVTSPARPLQISTSISPYCRRLKTIFLRLSYYGEI